MVAVQYAVEVGPEDRREVHVFVGFGYDEVDAIVDAQSQAVRTHFQTLEDARS